jgi:phosphatidylserine/phosphatidylglycerophosphate/cardiolipin synthase-like enzyme
MIFLASLRSTATIFLICWTSLADAQQITAFFTPRDDTATAVSSQIDTAKKSILVAAYSLSEPTITAALLDAAKRGVEVHIIVNKTQQNDYYSTAPNLFQSGIDVVADLRESLFHNKYIVIDDSIVITGSMNYTKAGTTRNAENVLIITHPPLAKRYNEDWDFHYNHASPFRIKHSRKDHLQITPPGRHSLPNPARKKETLSWHALPVP